VSALYRDEGVVLRTWKLGEADRIVVFMTQGHGKVRAVAKGVRKTRSKFGARLEPTTNVAVQFYEGRELDIVTQAETIDYFRSIRDDLDLFARASAMLEVVDQLAFEKHPNVQLYQMLVGGLRTLAAQPAPLVVPAFFFKLLALEGFRPVVHECVECNDGDGDGLVAFDFESGGALCQRHRRGSPLSPEALALLQAILGGRLNAALEAPESPATHLLDDLATRAVEHHLERRLRSVGVLHQA
jgi:DNA repair protein RecO (recombination protein O)